MDFLATPFRRRVLFAALYLSEGAPMGFIWYYLPGRLTAAGVAVDEVTALSAMLGVPWTFKFLWAPLVDILRTRRFTLRHWILATQCVMALSLAPLLGLTFTDHLPLLTGLLFLHALAAATQDASIDALCIAVTEPEERGRLNGWMQCGMLLGRLAIGGGALFLAQQIGDDAVILLVMALTLFSMGMVLLSKLPQQAMHSGESMRVKTSAVFQELRITLALRVTWACLLFALLAGAAFEAAGVIYIPMLIQRGFTQQQVGAFAVGPMVAMMCGSLLGGWLADRLGKQRFVALALLFVTASVAALAVSDYWAGGQKGYHLLAWLCVVFVGIGLFTTASYALFMDLTNPAIAATQFSAFMGATNACENWSAAAVGSISKPHGYPLGLLAMCLPSLLALPLLWWMVSGREGAGSDPLEESKPEA